ncbi:uncharacterized protein DS421_16g553280 [Arachis hypogaea]|nr:uncharacterized protein DS421_16g553280 [Arachis hypogaea]
MYHIKPAMEWSKTDWMKIAGKQRFRGTKSISIRLSGIPTNVYITCFIPTISVGFDPYSRKVLLGRPSALAGRRKLTCDKRKVTMSHLKHVNLESDDPSSQGHTYQSSVNKPAESMVYFKLSLVEDLASELAEENMMVVREETQFEALAIIPIQVCLPLSQTTTMPEIEETPETENEPTPVLQIEGTTKGKKYTPEPPSPPPQQLEESTPTLPPAPSKINPATEDAAALMMMARIASYVPKIDPMPSFSLGFTDSSQEEAATQEGVSTQDGGRAKTPKTSKLLEQLWDLFETPARMNQHSSDMKEKCYLWAIRFDTVCTLQAQDRYILSKLHLASLAPETHIEAEIVSAMCFILNQQKIKRSQEEVYCLPPDIVVRVASLNFGCIFCIPDERIIYTLFGIVFRYFLAEIEGPEQKSDLEAEK